MNIKQTSKLKEKTDQMKKYKLKWIGNRIVSNTLAYLVTISQH